MKLIHTSDWHIGRSLYGRKRYDEFESFLDWLAELIEKEKIDALLVAGDIFDNSTPSNRAQGLYYRFLCRTALSSCRHVVVIAGNHDSPSFLNAPRELLRSLNVHVVGSPSETPSDEVLVLKGEAGEPELIVCAVPYLRDRDIRRAEAGESLEDKDRKLVEGIIRHYSEVCSAAETIRAGLKKPVPIAAMGHLFTAGGRTVEGDGVRELYVGSLAHVGSDIFPSCIDYLALGHLHAPQMVGGSPVMRYSGSPLPMGFGEAAGEKSVVRLTFSHEAPDVEKIPVPNFQVLERISGDWDTVSGRIDELKAMESSAWLEILYEGDEIAAGLNRDLAAAVEGTGMEILRVKNSRVVKRALQQMDLTETLDDLSVDDVFKRCLDAHEVSGKQRDELMRTFSSALAVFRDEDPSAE